MSQAITYFHFLDYFHLGTLPKKTGKCGNFEEKKQGWGSTQIPHPFFTVFNMGDPPTINVSKVLKCKINHNFFLSQTWGSQTGGRGGGPQINKYNVIFMVEFFPSRAPPPPSPVWECHVFEKETKIMVYFAF